MATTGPSRFVRLLLVLLGAVLLGVGMLFLSMPKPQGPRVEATTKIVGVLSPRMYAWIIRTEHGAALIDTGLDPTGKAIFEELKKQGVGVDQVHSVFLTHGHPDHTAGAIAFSKAKVYVGRRDVALMRGTEKPVKLPGLFAMLGGMPAVPGELLPLEGGETIDADGTAVKVIAAPGHTDGSMMFLVGEVLFTGDSLGGDHDSVDTAPSYFQKDAEENRRSLKMLVDVPFTLIADGHTGATANAREKLKAFVGGD